MAQAGPHFGATLGPSSSYLRYGSNGSSHYHRAAFTAGLTLRWWRLRFGSVAVNLGFVQKGLTQSDEIIHLNYLEAPLLLVGELTGSTARVQPFVAAGVAMAARTSCYRYLFTIAGPHEDGCEEARAATLELVRLRDWDARLDYRLGMRLRIAKGAALVEVRRVVGVVDIEPGQHTQNRFKSLVLGYEWR